VMAQLGTWDVETAARRIVDGHVCQMDINIISTSKENIASINCICFGLVGDVGIVAESLRFLGKTRYDAAAFWYLLKGFRQRMSITSIDKDGARKTTEGEFLTAGANHTQHFGTKLRVTPHAQFDDGLMDLFMVSADALSRGEQVAILTVTIPDGSHCTKEGIGMMQCQQCVVTFDAPGCFVVDGEIAKHDGTVTIKCVPQRIPIFADANAKAGDFEGGR